MTNPETDTDLKEKYIQSKIETSFKYFENRALRDYKELNILQKEIQMLREQ